MSEVLGYRCRHCGYVNDLDGRELELNRELEASGELGDGELAALARWSCNGCGLSVPAPPLLVPAGVDPFAGVRPHFEYVAWGDEEGA